MVCILYRLLCAKPKRGAFFNGSSYNKLLLVIYLQREAYICRERKPKDCPALHIDMSTPHGRFTAKKVLKCVRRGKLKHV